MNSPLILSKLQQLTGNLKPAPGTRDDDLKALELHLAERLIQDPTITVSGNRTLHAMAEGAEAFADPTRRFGHVIPILDRPVTGESTAPSPLIFRRETNFTNNLLGNSVPEWASGMAATQSFGPFIDEHGLSVWFDFYEPVKLTRVYIKGSPSPALLIRVRGITITAGRSYRIQPGSVWIASDLIARTSSLSGFFTGLKVRGGVLELSEAADVSTGDIVINPNTTASLHLDLNQNTPAAGPREAGQDASNAVVNMPQTLDLAFDSAKSKFRSSDASCTLFGCEAAFRFEKAAPVWLSAVGQILIPYSVTTSAQNVNNFRIFSSDSRLCNIDKKAKIAANSGWLLPAAKIDPASLGQASGTGALCISLSKGITASWQGLKGGVTTLVQPAIITEPGQITVVDFFAQNLYGRMRWRLWRNKVGRHHSDIRLGFGKAFPFIFVSTSNNSEAVFFFCNHKASFDRPVDGNGEPFKIESIIAFAGIVQSGSRFRALVFDNDLLFDGNTSKPDAFRRHSIILRNALFSVTRPYSLFLTGELENDENVTDGIVALMYGIYLYLPTLPDPYVASYTHLLRQFPHEQTGNPSLALAGFVEWPNAQDQARVYFRLAPLDLTAAATTSVRSDLQFRATRDIREAIDRKPALEFQSGVRTFNREMAGDIAAGKITSPAVTLERILRTDVLRSPAGDDARDRMSRAIESGEIHAAINEIEGNPLLGHIKDKSLVVDQTLASALQQADRGFEGEGFPTAARASTADPNAATAGRGQREALRGIDMFMLLDVSSNADQLGVSLGARLRVEQDDRGEVNIRRESDLLAGATPASDMPLQIHDMDVVMVAQYLRAVTLPQISWEPFWNIPLPIEGMPDPLDLITVMPGMMVFPDDGMPTRIFSESPERVPIAPRPVTTHFLKEYNDEDAPRALHSYFTLPFGMEAQSKLTPNRSGPSASSPRVSFNMPYFDELRGGIQIKAIAPDSTMPGRSASFEGRTLQLDNLEWFVLGLPIWGSTLGLTVKTIFNEQFFTNQPEVPLEKIEFSGYGASMFSNWLDAGAAIANVSQAKFDVLVGRTAHEVVQVRSVLYPFGVHVVRTVTLMRSPNGYVYRSDSGWKAESDGFYDFSYKVNLKGYPTINVPNPYVFHKQPVKGVSNVREIRDFPDGGTFLSSFALNDPDLPPAILTNMDLPRWKKLFQNVTSLNDKLGVRMQAVVFDADVHLDNVTSGGVKDPAYGDFKVLSRKMLGYVQLAPSSVLIPSRIFADLLDFQNGSLGGPVDCVIDIGKSNQRMRITRVDVNPARDNANKVIFSTAARGSLILPPDGSWAVVKQQTDTGDVKPLEQGQSVPLIKHNASTRFRIAHPADVENAATSKTNFGVLQSTGTQKLLFDIPQFEQNAVQKKMLSSQTYFADAYKLLNSKGVFPNVANALALTNAEKEVEILGEGLMKMAERDINLNTLLPPNYEYAFVNEPGILKIYAQYKSTNNMGGNLKLGIDSAAALADKWKAALSNIRVIVDLGPFKELCWVDGNFNAASGLSAKYDRPNLQFGPMLKPVVDILRVLAALSGNEFDRGMDVGMSNSPDNWEYKFNCSKEIPVIKFPSPEQLTINPNPPLKLEAGLKLGFYFNEVLSIPTDLKQLVPACGAYVTFQGGLQVMCFTLAAASVYAVGKVELGIAADTKAGISVFMKFGFGVEIVVGLPVVGNASVLYMIGVTVGISAIEVEVGAFMLFRGSAEICGGLVAVCIQIEAGGSVERKGGETNCIAQVTFSIDITILWVIDIEFSDSWQESRQIS